MSLLPIMTPARSAFRFDNIAYTGDAANLTSEVIRAVWFRPGGSQVFIAEDNATEIYGKNPGSAFDITDVVSTTTITLPRPGTPGTMRDIGFNLNGTKVFVLGATTIEEYTLSTAYGGTAAYVGNLSVPSSPTVRSFAFNNDGTKLITQNGNQFNEATLSTGFLLSSAGSFSTTATLSELNAQARDFGFGRNGARIIAVNGAANSEDPENGKLYEFALSSAFDVSTAAATGETYTPEDDTGAEASTVDYSDGGDLLFVTRAASGTSDDIFKFSTVT